MKKQKVKMGLISIISVCLLITILMGICTIALGESKARLVEASGLSSEKVDVIWVNPNQSYVEKIAEVGEGAFIEYDLYFDQGGQFIVQTFGDCDTVLTLYDNIDGSKVASDDDSGYAYNGFIRYNFHALAQSSYRVRIAFNSLGTTGEVKLAISSVSSQSVYTYGDIQTALVDGASGINGLSMYAGQANLYKVRSDAGSTVNLRTLTTMPASMSNMVISVIDPRSTSPIVNSNFGYDNMTQDTGDGIKGVIKTLGTGAEYMVVIAASDMTTMSGVFNWLWN